MQRPREAPTQQATETHRGRRLPRTQATCKGPHYCHGEASGSGLSMHGNDAAVPSGISGRKIRASGVLPLPGKPLNLNWHFPVHVAGVQSVATVGQHRNQNGSPNMEPNRRSSLWRGLDLPCVVINHCWILQPLVVTTWILKLGLSGLTSQKQYMRE
jgi:hypothetical protein